MYSGTRVSYRGRVSCVPGAGKAAVYVQGASWRYERLEFINGRRANDKSRVCLVSRRGFLFARKGHVERRGRKEGTEGFAEEGPGNRTSSFEDELLPCTSRSYLADKSAPVFTRATRLRDDPGIRDRGFLKIRSIHFFFLLLYFILNVCRLGKKTI